VSPARIPASSLRIAVALGGLLLVAGCKTQLDSGLSEREANEEVALLLRQNIPAARETDPKTGTLTVMVEKGSFADAVDLLRAHGLPHEHYASIADVFKGNGLVTSPTEERARMIYALGEELSRTISEIDGVLTARVHIVMADNDPLRTDTPPASASVFVGYKPDADISGLVPQIKMLVANGVSGLAYDRVSVVMRAEGPPPSSAAAQAEQAPALTEVGGFWVFAGDARALQLVLAAAAGMGAILLGAGGWFAWRSRRLVVGLVQRRLALR
jgi:type III secretion protein J